MAKWLEMLTCNPASLGLSLFSSDHEMVLVRVVHCSNPRSTFYIANWLASHQLGFFKMFISVYICLVD